MKSEIELAVNVLIGKPMWKSTRAADMASFQFGGRRTVQTFRGDTKEVGDFALHVQCAWRITMQEEIIVGSRDLYYPADFHGEDQDIPDDFDWDRDPNRRDKLLASLFMNNKREFVVQEIEVGIAGSLNITLSDSLSFGIFPDDSLSREHWRLFRPANDEPHFVVTGRGIEA